ncbi:MAG TPA: aromatic ring-hydroxylating dioxygenase subunit alpha [Burkholderiaceae bacterium]|jgi:phenylpropionate dioxygenase-like ring-hydroxylating dioxygenase large terminal subunit|nr:aromatic ring-hydroxylating dioxygenase subunit alpha [Burkholderiaceae bacterium]
MSSNADTIGESLIWPDPQLTRIPFRLYDDPRVFALEQQRLFQGPTWNYLCLENEVPQPGDYVTTFVGEMPVVVARGDDGELYGFENRCAHRGALICLEDRGHARDFQCVYHAWTYDLQGNLKAVAFQNGVDGKGGMPKTFRLDEHGPRKLRIASFSGLVFGSLDDDVPDLDEYLGDEIASRIERVLGRPLQVLGRFTQSLPNNWKLYVENVKDSYHASLLHLFFTTFRINRLNQRGGVIVSEAGGHHVSWSAIDRSANADVPYSDQKLRSDSASYRLADPGLLEGVDEYGDGVTLQILSVFPNLVVQQIQNCLAVRQVLPKGVARTELKWTYVGYADDDERMREMRLQQANLVGPAGYVSMEDGAVGNFVQRGIAGSREADAIVEMGGDGVQTQETRATEVSVRGFWKAYRSYLEI